MPITSFQILAYRHLRNVHPNHYTRLTKVLQKGNERKKIESSNMELTEIKHATISKKKNLADGDYIPPKNTTRKRK